MKATTADTLREHDNEITKLKAKYNNIIDEFEKINKKLGERIEELEAKQ